MSNETTQRYPFALVTLTTLFFMWGFITCLNDILIPYLKEIFELTHFQSNLVQLAFVCTCFRNKDCTYISAIRLEAPITLVGLTALSVEIITKRSALYLIAMSAIFFVPNTLARMAWVGKSSISGTCL